jgi:hypothetical protein
MNRMHSRWLTAAALALWAAGCAQSNGDISYVQPNVMKKSDLVDGVWYFRNTVTDTPPNTGFTFTGETGDLEKIVFEIQEGYLVGYRSYPMIQGQDGTIEESSVPSGITTRVCKGEGTDRTCTGGHKYYGAPVVAYPIERHFDIQRTYNASTGETTNVIAENTVDRPWNEREFIRVNWTAQVFGKNLGRWGIINPSGQANFTSWIYPNEPGTDSYDWPRQEYQDVNGEQKLKYFEFTARYNARPDTMYFRGYGNVPFCFLNVGYGYDCTAQQISMRTSIAKVDPNRTLDYEPLIYDNSMMAKFGYFRTERMNYDRRFGINESDVVYLANRHRIWESSYQRDAQGNVDWSRPIPVEQRQPKPIVYYVPPARRMGGEAEYRKYLEAGRVMETNWNRAFRRAVAAAKGQGNNLDGVPDMFVVCENPVPAGAPAACGATGFEARFGDLRYNFVWTIPDAIANGLLGYGPSSPDPETGEIISANANTYSAAVARQAQHALNMVNILSQDYSIDEVISGKDVRDYMLQNLSYAGKNGAIDGTSSNRLMAELQGDAVQVSAEPTTGAFSRLTPNAKSVMTKLKAQGGLPVATGDRMNAAAELLAQNPALESLILDNPEIGMDALQMLPAELQARAEWDPAGTRDALRNVLTRPGELLAMQQARQEYASQRNIYLDDFLEDRTMIGLALKEAQRRTLRIAELMAQNHSQTDARRLADEEIRVRFQQNAWRSTTEHEVGHTLGLRHNFQGSYDSVNYFDRYWELKKDTLTVLQNGQPVIPRTPTDLKKASDGTELQVAAGMHDHEYSSIMDYNGKVNSDWQGVGKYDEAAIIFAYSGGTTPGYVEVFDVALPQATRNFPGSDGKQVQVTGAGYDLPVVNAMRTNTAVPTYTERFHYSTVPLRFGTSASNDVEEIIGTGIQNLRKRRLMKWSEVEAKQNQLRGLLKNNPVPAPLDVQAINPPAEVPYAFCTDDHVNFLVTCNRWDRGPDLFEINKTRLESYWNDYFLNHFRRDRYNFSPNSAFSRAANTFIDSATVYKHWMHAMFGGQGANQQNIPNFTSGPFGYDPLVQDYWTMAVFDGINDLLKVMSIPDAGFYVKRRVTLRDHNDPNGPTKSETRWDLTAGGVDFDSINEEAKEKLYVLYGGEARADLKRGMGRRMFSRYDHKTGFGFQYRMTEVGHYIDQIGAYYGAVLPQANFIGVDRVADLNRYNIPYYLMFRNELNEVFGALWLGDGLANNIRPTLFTDELGTTPGLSYPVHVNGLEYIAGFDYPKGSQVSAAGRYNVAPANIPTTWTSRVYALYFGMALFNVNYDMDYAKRNQVFRLGGGEDITIPTGYQVFETTDPVSGARYAAVQPEKVTQDTPAVRMIKEVNLFHWYLEDPRRWLPASQQGNPELVEQARADIIDVIRNRIRDLDIMRGMYQTYGKAF